ncbi:hypothetical protein PDE_07995 [Penicillium oxalicum 114-2]|uniref:RRM domain-containing protein n=1 Tax=Penicillium oxalicum (strain 114-2 / CGMCC 5302) TaxID=933388 RepID=S7ZRH5_PENO1|nr:hypothetical protein PDE_07995 [Penicillium oxalicum 114-2]
MHGQSNEASTPGVVRGSHHPATPFPWAGQVPNGPNITQGANYPVTGISPAPGAGNHQNTINGSGNQAMANPQQASMHNHTSSRVGRFSSGNRFVSMDNFFVPATPGNVSSYYDPHTPLTVMSNPTPLAGRLSMHPAPGVYCACPHQLNCPYSQGLVFNPGPPAGPNGFGGPGELNGPNGSNPFNWPGNGNAFFNSQTPNAPFSSGPGYQGADHFSQAATLNPGPLQTMRTPTGYVTQNLEALTQREPAIPRAVPSVWNDPAEVNLSKSLENREGIRNVYIRGLHPNTTDQMIYDYAIRFGDIERCKAIVDLDTGTCKGFGFVEFKTLLSCENAIRAFHYLGYQASFAQRSRNARLKDLEDKSSTNIYCTNIPVDWTEADLRRHFEPYQVVSEKISRDEATGVSKEVGFARFETREIAEQVLADFHNVTVPSDNVKLLLRFADTKAQKMLKQQSNQRRAIRSGQYSMAVQFGQHITPSPNTQSGQHTGATGISPASEQTMEITPESQPSVIIYTGDSGPANWSPATSTTSPIYATPRKLPPSFHRLTQSDLSPALECSNVLFGTNTTHRRSLTENSVSAKTVRVGTPSLGSHSPVSSPRNGGHAMASRPRN